MDDGMIEAALRLAAEDGTASACVAIAANGDAVSAAQAFSDVARRLAKQDVSKAVALWRSGIEHALEHADVLAVADPDTARRLREIAKIMAYNLGAETWPGWSKEGAPVSESDRRSGHEAALLSLRLVESLGLGAKQLGTGHWLVGAHELALGNDTGALTSFDRALAHFESGGYEDCALLARGYAAIARQREVRESETEGSELPSVLAALSAFPSSDAPFFREQLITAQEIFCRSRSARMPRPQL